MHNKLKEIRKNKGISINEMSRILNISKPYYSQLENEKRRLFYDMALKIANVFDMKPDDIFYDEHKNRLKI